ncbi:hypothetical protein, partial [Dictyobacter arantiisoli]|uniref:hypothetical protein n=1 Tax=Dictyobacter arantiisoli TaxID=2014874 RepID=UPI001C0E99DA
IGGPLACHGDAMLTSSHLFCSFCFDLSPFFIGILMGIKHYLTKCLIPITIGIPAGRRMRACALFYYVM